MGDLKQQLVVIVDDEDDIVTMIAAGLKRRGLSSLRAKSAAEAKALIEKEPRIGVVVTDINMPGQSGLDLAAELSAQRSENQALEFIFITGLGTKETVMQALRQGAFDFIDKPFEVKTLIKRIEDARIRCSERRIRAQRVEFLASFDPLTELPNRVQFQERLEDMLECAHAPIALLFIDFDDFKAINDTYGHAAGDAVLQRVGKILFEASETNGGFSARVGGDEFALVAPTDDPRMLLSLCDFLIAQSSIPFLNESKTIPFSVSIGMATTTQVIGGSIIPTIDTLSRAADFALCSSISNGGNCYTIYDLVLEKGILEQRAMLTELPRAIANEDLEIYLQPKVEIPSCRVYGFEALVRWRRDGKIINPDEFIRIAEETGLVVEIDNLVLNQAAKLIATHNTRFGTDFSVSVNLSAIHFASRKIVKLVEDALWRSDLKPELLTLEITESTEVYDCHEANAIIESIHQLGCKISIDDFGTGFSSLANLRAMIADELKVDRSLVEEIQTSEKARLMLASVLEIARHMELDVVVEGVETEAHLKIVNELGARRVQGFLFGAPNCADIVLKDTLTPEAINRLVS